MKTETRLTALESWESLFRHYRGTELAILYLEAIRQGLKYGSITADNLEHIDVVNRKVIGACVKGLSRAGLFERIGYEPSKSALGHGRTIGRWQLKDIQTARLILSRVSGMVEKDCVDRTGQLMLC